MIIIAFEENILLGGFGDRIIRLISCYLISKLLKKKFYILWNKENIKKYFDYSKYDFELTPHINNENIKIYNSIDRQGNLKNYLLKNTEIFPDKINKFYLNQEISQYLYKNKLFQDKDYHNDILACYKNLYNEIFIPTPFLLNKINSIVGNNNNIIGIQIRCGDFFMVTNKNNPIEPQFHRSKKYRENIQYYLLNIKKLCDSKLDNYYIFLTSDNSAMYDETIKIFDQSMVLYDFDLIQHIDRTPIDNNISKVFVDNYILSQKTTILFISDYSNYGRLAALSSVHDNIYNLDCCKLDKKTLLSKHEKY